MKRKGNITCPEHGKFEVCVETNPHVELAARYTAPCPKCGKRLPVNF